MVRQAAEVVDGYQPDIIWQDFNLGAIPGVVPANFLSYYYNRRSPGTRKSSPPTRTASTTRARSSTTSGVARPACRRPYWLTDDSVCSSSWCYTAGIGYYSPTQMLHSLIDRVSKNGNMLLNIAPMADGTIPSGQRTVLLGIGDYLKPLR